MSKILILGSNGYFGTVLFEYLKKKGMKCQGTDIDYFKDCNLFKKKTHKTLNSCSSLLDEDYLKNFDTIIALAGYSNNPIFKKNEKKFHNKEFRYLTKIARICKKKKIKYIFPSSCSLYGKSHTEKKLDENSKINPITHYSLNKRKIEKFLINLSDKNFKPIILRFATLYGLSQKMRFDIVINMFCGSAIAQNKIELNSDGKVFRPFIEISDACKAIYKVIKINKNFKGQIFNVGSNLDNYRIIDVAKIVQRNVKGSKIIFLKKIKKLVSDNLIVKGKDKRNYKVNFDLFSKTFKFKADYKIDNGIKKLILNLKRLKLTKSKFKSTKFYRLQYLQELNKKNKLIDY